MREFLTQRTHFFAILIIWFLVGAFVPVATYVLIPLTLILLKSKGNNEEIFFGFIFILVLSDNLYPATLFAKSVKNIYVLIFFFFAIKDMKFFTTGNQIYRRFLPFFAMAILCLIFSPSISTALQKTLSYIILFVSVPIYVTNLYMEKGKQFLKDIVYYLVLITIIGYLLRFISYEIAFSHGSRFRGVFGNPNGLAIFLLLTYLSYQVITDKFRDLFDRNEKIFILVVLYFAIFLTFSRNALIAVVCFEFLHRIFKISNVLGFFIFISGFLFFDSLYTLILDAVNIFGLQQELRIDSINEASGRLIAWEFAWQNIQNSIFVGKGFFFDESLMRANYLYLSKLGHEGGVHNTYLIIWLNTGLIGLLFFLRGFFLVFINASKKSKIAFPIMLTVMLTIMFEPWLAASLNPFTILFLFIVTILNIDLIDDESENNEIEA